MLDGVTFEQLRTFIASADAGSFSAAARRLHRAQSVVSQTVANLEAHLGVKLFDRSHRSPALTEQGRALLASARAVMQRLDEFKGRTKALAGGLEAELSVVIDVLFPMDAVTRAIGAFQAKFPLTPLRLFVEALGAVAQPVLDRHCQFGVMGSLPIVPAEFSTEPLASVSLTLVVSPQHALGAYEGPIPMGVLREHLQLVLTDRSELSKGREFGVLSPRTWRLSDLGAKHEFLRAGLGWGGMPCGMVAADIAAKVLKPILIEDTPSSIVMPMSAVYRTDAPPGPAGRWLIEQFKQMPLQAATASEKSSAAGALGD
jgi:DNA-binding transcriptional LysR family regulator